MIRPLLTVFITSLSITLLAQKNFIPGYVIQNSGDTLVGTINHMASKRIATHCEFKKNKEDNTTTYTPESALGYGFLNGKQFIVKDVPVDSGKTKRMFLEILVRGKVSLYRNFNQFFAEKDKLYLLEIKTVALNSDVVKDGLEGTSQNMEYEQKKKTYVGILNYLFIDCPGISKEVSDVNLNEPNLVKIAEKYNQCVGAEYSVQKKKNNGPKVDILVAAGLNSNSLSFTSTYLIKFPSVKDKSQSPMLSFGIQARNSLVNENLSATAEIQFSKETYTGQYEYEGPTYLNTYDFTLKYSRIKIPVGLKFKFSTGKIATYVRCGAGFNIYTSGHLKTKEKIIVISSGKVTETNTDHDITDLHMLDFWGSAGIQMSTGKVKTYLEIRGHLAAGEANNGVYTEGSGPVLVIDPKSAGSKDLGLHLGVLF